MEWWELVFLGVGGGLGALFGWLFAKWLFPRNPEDHL